jgi:hypothetical protein
LRHQIVQPIEASSDGVTYAQNTSMTPENVMISVRPVPQVPVPRCGSKKRLKLLLQSGVHPLRQRPPPGHRSTTQLILEIRSNSPAY